MNPKESVDPKELTEIRVRISVTSYLKVISSESNERMSVISGNKCKN